MPGRLRFLLKFVITNVFAIFLLSGAQAGKPLIAFAAQTPTNITIEKDTTAQIIYNVINHSSKSKTLYMKPLMGINSTGPCQAQAHGTCTLTLNINGTTLRGDVIGGPILCHEGDNLQCYQPNASNVMRIHQIDPVPVTQYSVTPVAGGNGSISPQVVQVVNARSNFTFTATPDTNYGVYQWLLDGVVVQNGGLTYQLNNIQANHQVDVTFNQVVFPQYTVTPSPGGNGSIAPVGAQLVNPGSNLSFTATPDANFGVNEWLLDGVVVQSGGTSYQLNNIQADHTVDVTFVQTAFTVTPSAGGNGAITPSGAQVLNAGTNQLFTATPDPNFEVDEWLLDGVVVQTGGTTYQVTNIQADQTIHVTFKQITYTLTISAGANGSISPQGSQVVNAGSSLAFTATPVPTFAVNEWLLDGNSVQSGGTSYQLNNIQSDHSVQVTFHQTTLSPATQNLALSISSNALTPALVGNARIIRITNTGSIAATNVQVSADTFPAGTSITANTCSGTLSSGASCNITITPGTTASPLTGYPGTPCTTKQSSAIQPAPVPTVVTLSADNTPSTTVNVLVLGYGCVYQGGYIFSVDDTTTNTGSIGGKVAALQIENDGSGNTLTNFRWANANSTTNASNTYDGTINIAAIGTLTNFPAAQRCDVKVDAGYSDWYLPASRELLRYGAGVDLQIANIYTMLYQGANIANYTIPNGISFWASTEVSSIDARWTYFIGNQTGGYGKTNPQLMVLCVRKLTQ